MKMPNPSGWRAAQRGQALSEFLVVAVALVPLFLLVPVIAKYQDIAHATQMASRYAAFDALLNTESSTRKSPGQLQDEVRRRFFSTSDAPIKTDDVAGDFKAHQNLFWRTPDARPMIARFSDVTLAQSRQESHDAGVGQGGPFAFTFGGGGIDTAQINVTLARLPSGLKFYEPFDKIDLSMSRATSVLGDAWTGKNPSDVQSKSGAPSFVPANPAPAQLARVMDPLITATEVGIKPPQLASLEFWSDVVPVDRLVPP